MIGATPWPGGERRHPGRRWWPAAVALIWVARYWASFGLHLWSPSRWVDWFDQANYVRSAAAFAHGDLSAAAHWYPLGYPLLAAPFYRLTPGEPFFLVDLGLFVIGCAGFATAMARIGIGRPIAVIAFVATALIVDSTASLWLIPWNTTLSAALLWWLIAIGAGLIVDDRAITARRAVAFGLIAGALPAARSVDALPAACALATVAIILGIRRRLSWRTATAAMAGAALIPAAYLALHLAIYGAHPSRYMIEAARQGFVFADLPWKAYVLIITPAPWYLHASSLIERLPWLLPGAAGLAVIAMMAPRSARAVVVLIAAVAFPLAALFLAYTDLQPPGLWEFNNAHYFKWLFPLFGVGVWMWLRAIARGPGRWIAIGAAAVLLALACVRIVPVPAADDEPARLLMCRGATGRDWNEAYFTPSTIVDARGALHNVREFHQFPDAAGEHAVAVTRSFAADPRRFDPGEAPRYRAGEPPYARYREKLSVGIPCWFPVATCTLPR